VCSGARGHLVEGRLPVRMQRRTRRHFPVFYEP
jgi:hypothetical protein